MDGELNKPKWQDALFIIYQYHFKGKEIYIAELEKIINLGHRHCCNLVYNLEDNKLIERNNTNGRKKYIKLTNEGIKYAEVLTKLKELE